MDGIMENQAFEVPAEPTGSVGRGGGNGAEWMPGGSRVEQSAVFSDDGQGEAVGPQSEQADEGEGEGPLGEQGGHAGGTGPRPREPDRSEATAFSAENARLLEQETTARLQKQFDEEVAGLGIPNPYTGKPFKSFKEFQEYGARFRKEKMEGEAKRQGRPVEELREEEENRSFLSRKRREEREQREAMAALEKQKEFLRADLEAFLSKFPGVDPGQLEQNAKFKKFAGKRLYKEPLSELYADFVDLVSDAERAAVAKATGRAARSTGGGQGGGMDMLTPAQRAELEEWNKARPEKKMTAKQFLDM